MDEIKKTLSILKARWPEVVLIMSISILSPILHSAILAYKKEPPLTLDLIALGYLILSTIIICLLIVGFLRTVYLEGDELQSPIVLLKTGMHFWGRMLILSLLYLLIYYVLLVLTFSIIKMTTSADTGFYEIFQSYSLLGKLYFILLFLILIKPLLLTPAIIIVLDCKILESFKFLKNCRLFNAKGLLILILISIVFGFRVEMFTKINPPCFLIFLSDILMKFINLMTLVTAVKFVASLNLIYNEPPTFKLSI